MLRSLIICPDEKLMTRLDSVLRGLCKVIVFKSMARYPHAAELLRALRAHEPDLIFLSFESIEEAQEIVRFLDSRSEGTQIIALSGAPDPQISEALTEVGVRDLVTYPFEERELLDALQNASALIERRTTGFDPTTQIVSFLPSKAGSGTSTLALNVSGALARRQPGRVLLTDFDLNSGMVRFLLKLEARFSVLHAVERCLSLDEELWRDIATTVEKLDVLHAGRINPSLRIEARHIWNLIGCMCRKYHTVCFDLSGNLERYSVEIMRQSRRVLLVCTPEVPSLHLAREKLEFLQSMGLENRVGLVLNRVPKKPLFTQSEVEELLGVPVFATMPNDYHGVSRAMGRGSLVDPQSELGKQHTKFAASLIESRTTPPGEGRRKFLEFFTPRSHALQR